MTENNGTRDLSRFPVQRGMGLGLFLARLMAQHMGGSLKLRSAIGKGTTSTLTFPREWK